MIKRRASEIIKLALTMSNAHNTDALSWRDKVDMLNQSYTRLYNDLNSKGDLYYSKELEFTPEPDKIKLPPDFYKLLLIGYRGTYDEIVPIQRSPNVGAYHSGYRIENNYIRLSGLVNRPIVVRYIPKPQDITFPVDGYNIGGNFVTAAYDSNNDIVFLGQKGRLMKVINNQAASRVIESLTDPGFPGEDHLFLDDPFVIALSGGLIYLVTETKLVILDMDLYVLEEIDDSFDLYIHAIGAENGVIVSKDGNTYKFIYGEDFVSSPDYWTFIDGRIVKKGNTFVYETADGLIDINDIFSGADNFVIADPMIYINKNGEIKSYFNFEEMGQARARIGKGNLKGLVLAAECNNETGLGVVFRDFYTGIKVTGWTADTVMNYPNNLFFDWLIADLAVKFRIVLGIPTMELPALAEDYYNTLMKSFSQDAFQKARIINVYGRRSI